MTGKPQYKELVDQINTQLRGLCERSRHHYSVDRCNTFDIWASCRIFITCGDIFSVFKYLIRDGKLIYASIHSYDDIDDWSMKPLDTIYSDWHEGDSEPHLLVPFIAHNLKCITMYL